MEQDKGSSKPTGGLEGKVALITGAAQGIGRAIALELARRGAVVAANYRTSKVAAETLAEDIRRMGGECLLVPGNVTIRKEAVLVVGAVIERFLRLDILVNNAGITRDKSLRKRADDEWADVIDVNTSGVHFCTDAALPHMIEHRFGRIINITAHIGRAGGALEVANGASKHGIAATTRALALDVAKYNITANCISPGYTCTEMLSRIPAEIIEALKAQIPIGRLAMPEEIGKAAGFLAADADYITGQELGINGGALMA